MQKLVRSVLVGFVAVSLLLTSTVFAAQETQTTVAPSVSSVIPGNVYIPRGTMLQAELLTGVNSGQNNVGDKVMFKLTESLVLNGTVVIPKGTAGEAVVKSVKKAGSFGKGGGIELEARSTKTLNNVEVPLSLDTKKYGGGQGMFVPWLLVGVFSGFIRGKNQDIPTGTKFSVAVDSDVDLGIKPELLADTMKNPVVATVQ